MSTKLLLAVACAALALAACATTPHPLAHAQEPATGCVPQTATRLPMKGSECAGFGVRFTDSQLNSTGQPYAEQELRVLDTAALGSGH
jgi:uncharacterized protein YecT (DUF1311 family)